MSLDVGVVFLVQKLCALRVLPFLAATGCRCTSAGGERWRRRRRGIPSAGRIWTSGVPVSPRRILFLFSKRIPRRRVFVGVGVA